MLGSITPHLIAIGVVFVLALVITFAVNRKTVADAATRKLIHSESWLVFLVAAVVAVAMMLFGPLATLLNNASAERYMLSEQTVTAANDLAEEVQSEGITMLKNTDGNLPLADTKVNVFGWASTNPVYGGTGSGSMNVTYPTVSVLQGMANAGLETNEELSRFYTDYNNPDDEMPTTGADNGLRLADLRDADYDDPRWEQLLDQLTFDEMDNLIAFAGRNFEYFSEDPVLAGVLASGEVAGAQAQGVYAFVKHFALNDQEVNRQSMLCTWATEQSIREIYMKPFEMTVKDGGTTAIMSAYNYIGPIYAGASENLLYTAVNSWMYENGEPQTAMPVWQVAAYAGIAVAAVAFLVLETLAIKRYRDRHKVARS